MYFFHSSELCALQLSLLFAAVNLQDAKDIDDTIQILKTVHEITTFLQQTFKLNPFQGKWKKWSRLVPNL